MPKLSTHRITKRFVDALQPEKDALYFDADLRGFGVRTKPSGTKTYLVQYEFGGRTRRITIGAHGALTPSEARQQAQVLLGRVRTGQNPAEDRYQERQALTVAQLCQAYLGSAEKGLILGKKGNAKKASTLTTDRGRITRHIIPLLGHRKVRDVTTPDIVRFMRDVSAGKTAADVRTKPRGRAIVEGGRGTAARTVGLLGGILSYAVSEGIIAANPARGVRRPADQKRSVRLSDDEYRQLGTALALAIRAGESWQATGAIELLALTGCRRGEIENLRWSEVDFGAHCLRLNETKTGESVRALGAPALELLGRLPRSSSAFVFPAMRAAPDVGGTGSADRPFSGLAKAWIRVRDRIASNDLVGLTPHGLRHAFASVAHDLGYTEPTIAALLGHSTKTITGRYIHQIDKALISAADSVAAYIASYLNVSRELLDD